MLSHLHARIQNQREIRRGPAIASVLTSSEISTPIPDQRALAHPNRELPCEISTEAIGTRTIPHGSR